MAEHVLEATCMGKCVPFGSPVAKALTPALFFLAAYTQGRREGNEGASRRCHSDKLDP